MIGNAEIRDLVKEEHLVDNFEEACLRNCSYRLRVGTLIKPGGAEVLRFEGNKLQKGNTLCDWIKNAFTKICPSNKEEETPQLKLIEKSYELKPNELIIFQTKERIRMPLKLSGMYTALDSVAKQGILLINASIVEPGYEGYLSGVLLNFSAKSFLIKPYMEIVKINFSEVTGDISDKLHEKIEDYTEKLQEDAQNYTQTFLNIKGIEEDVIGKTSRRVRRNFTFGGVLLIFILALCTIEPVLYKYIWHDSWVPFSSTQIEFERSLEHKEMMQVIDLLTKKVDSLQNKMELQDVRKTITKSKAGI